MLEVVSRTSYTLPSRRHEGLSMKRGCVILTAGAIILVVVAVPWVLPILLPLVIGFIWCAADCVCPRLSLVSPSWL